MSEHEELWPMFNAIIKAVECDWTGHLPDCGYTDEHQECGCAEFGGKVHAALKPFAARLADAEARAEAAVVLPDDEELAELLSWTTGDFTRWMPTAHPAHNRWSWRGEGHGESMRDLYRKAARELREALRGDQ